MLCWAPCLVTTSRSFCDLGLLARALQYRESAHSPNPPLLTVQTFSRFKPSHGSVTCFLTRDEFSLPTRHTAAALQFTDFEVQNPAIDLRSRNRHISNLSPLTLVLPERLLEKGPSHGVSSGKKVILHALEKHTVSEGMPGLVLSEHFVQVSCASLSTSNID